MSFNTRSGRQAGRGAQQAAFPRQPQNPFQPQYQPAYSTPLSQPGPPGAGTSPQPLIQQQLQQQQLQQQPLQQQLPVQQQQPQQLQQQQMPVTPQFKMQQQPALTPPMKPPTPQVQPPQTQPLMEGEEIIPKEEEDHDEEGEPTKPWKKKGSSFKVNKVMKRRRQNARFRKLLVPKNAIMVLNELQPGISFHAEEHTNAFSQVCYTVRIRVQGENYTGEGTSKAAAKSAAAEAAVKGLILKKISDAGIKKSESLVEEESMDTAGSGDESSTNGKRTIPEDEVPWGSLASFALFKLFADWKSQGITIPTVLTPPPTKPVVKTPGAKPSVMKGLPDNPELLHPVTLVGRVFPGTVFTELSREGTPPHLTFCMGTTVNDAKHVGVAKSKKEAKKNCAIEVLRANNIPYNPHL